MKKIIILTGALCLLGSTAATAQISVTLGEPVYAAPAYGYVVAPDYPSEHYDHHRHVHNDYWARRGQEERAHHDNGNHGHK